MYIKKDHREGLNTQAPPYYGTTWKYHWIWPDNDGDIIFPCMCTI